MISVFEMSDVVSHVIVACRRSESLAVTMSAREKTSKRGFQTTRDTYAIMRIPESF
jgi:hypothetical protein